MKAVTNISTPAEWKHAMRERLQARGTSRYAFVRQVADKGICTRHTAECLLADDGTVTGQREPSFAVAIAMARLAGLEMTLRPTKGDR